MAKVRKLNVSQIEGENANGSNIRPRGEMALYDDGNNGFDLVIHDGIKSTNLNKVFGKGKFYGHNADSGDGAGYNTIKLIPDIGLFNGGSNQYLIVDPTGPNHIHIRAGGAQDSSNTDLFIGGEKNFVKVSDSSDNILISADDNNGSTKQWSFSSNGALTLPAYGVCNGFSKVYSSGLSLDGDNAFESNYAVLNLPTNNTANVSPTSLNNYNGNVQITAGVIEPNTVKMWVFDNTGSLNFPNGTLQNTAYTGTGDVSFTADTITTDTGNITIDVTQNINIVSGSNVEIITNNGVSSKTWTYKTNAAFEIPGGVYEKVQTKTDATGVIEHDCSNGHIFYHTSPDANWTANFTNVSLEPGYATTVVLIIEQGATGYYPDAIQINSVAQSINWQSNTPPTASANRKDVVTFSIVNNLGTYVIFGQLIGY